MLTKCIIIYPNLQLFRHTRRNDRCLCNDVRLYSNFCFYFFGKYYINVYVNTGIFYYVKNPL